MNLCYPYPSPPQLLSSAHWYCSWDTRPGITACFSRLP